MRGLLYCNYSSCFFFLARNPTSLSVPFNSRLIFGSSAQTIKISDNNPENIYSKGWSVFKNRSRRIKLPISGKLKVAKDA